MTEPAKRKRTKTTSVLVALDASRVGQAALDAGARLASELSAELKGLFVEDENLFRLSSLPFAREVDYTSGTSRPLHSPAVERALRAAAEGVEQELAHVAEQFKIRWTFEITRGLSAGDVLAAATKVDLVVIGQERSIRARQVSKAIPSAPILVMFDGTRSAHGALEIAARLARQATRPLIVFIAAPVGTQPEPLRSECEQWLRKHSTTASIRELGSGQFDLLSDFARRLHASVLIVTAASEGVDDRVVNKLVKELECPIVIVR